MPAISENLKLQIDSTIKDADLKTKMMEFANMDVNPATISCMEQILTQYPQNSDDLKKRFLNRLEFGTAGLRATMGPGYNNMNDVTVLQTSQGLAKYLINKFGVEKCAAKGVVIGYDARNNSKRFANICAAVFIVGGFKVYLYSTVTPTVLNPTCIVAKGCVCGVQITGDYNGKDDNGCKVFSDNGCPMTSPMDVEVTECIVKNLNRWDGVLDLLNTNNGFLLDAKKVTNPLTEITDYYLNEMCKDICCNRKAINEKSKLQIVYTAMQGVGWPLMEQLMKKFGIEAPCLIPVEEQKNPDPDFSTCAFPNPREKGTMDLAMTLADKKGAQLVIANDANAERFACMEKVNGKWITFTGDEMGIILANRMMQNKVKQGTPKNKMVFICSAVSSRMLEKMCKVEGCTYEETTTGFKNLMNKAMECRNKGLEPVCIYEEAFSYSVCKNVTDKDGVTAAAVCCDLACEMYEQNKTLSVYLDELKKLYGCFVSNNSYFTCDDKTKLRDLFVQFRNNGQYKWQIGDFKVKQIRDVTTGYDSGTVDKKCTFPVTPNCQMITLFFENNAVVTFRENGTESKLKYYSELCAATEDVGCVELKKVVDCCIDTIVQPAKNNLKKAME